jgi:hypothetical protein
MVALRHFCGQVYLQSRCRAYWRLAWELIGSLAAKANSPEVDAVLHHWAKRSPSRRCSSIREADLWSANIKIITEGLAVERACISNGLFVKLLWHSIATEGESKMLVNLSYRTDVVVVI